MAKVWDPFWIRAIQNEFVPQINALVDVLKERLLPTIDDNVIEAEANEITDREFERSISMPGTGDEDAADLAEMAEKAGISHFSLMHGIRQGMLNLFAASLYHTFEQQVMYFHRKNVLRKEEEDDERLFKMRVFRERLVEFGIELNHLPAWVTLDGELRLLSNAVKHADGCSARKLRQRRPELFRYPHQLHSISIPNAPPLPVFQPFVGDGLYVSLQDVEYYGDHVVQFWQELADQLRNERR